MDRREFGTFTLGTAAAAAGGIVPLAPAQAQEASLPRSIAQLPPQLHSLMNQSFAKFSDTEYARRERLLGNMMQQANVDHVLLVTWLRVGNSTEWITGWPGWIEAITVFKPGERMTMFVEYYNHIPLAQRMARNCDVKWSEDRGTAKAIEELKRRGAQRVGVIGPLIVPRYRQVEASFPTIGLDREYTNLRIYERSDEEIAWYRIGCALSDAAFSTLVREAPVGMTESELANLVERGYVPHGGSHIIHFIGTTSMAKPEVYVPLQFHSQRKLERGDVVFCELSAAFWGYSGQVLRSFTVEAEPTQLYRDLHATAEACYDAVTKIIRPGTAVEELIEATSIVEQNGFTVCDDVVHGYGGGYFQPIIEKPAGRRSTEDHSAREHVHGRPTQRDQPGEDGRRAGRRNGAGHQDRIREPAQYAARILQGGADGLSGLNRAVAHKLRLRQLRDAAVFVFIAQAAPRRARACAGP